MGEGSTAFVKGGCGCLVLFLVLGGAAMLLGGHAHLDAGGAIALFVIGGVFGLIVLRAYHKGEQAGRSQGSDAPPWRPGHLPELPAWQCESCGRWNEPGTGWCKSCRKRR